MRSVGIALEIPEWVPQFLELLPREKIQVVQPEATRRIFSVACGDRQLLVSKVRGYSPGLAKDLESMRLEDNLTDVIRLGTCGGYHEDHRIGDVILCTDAIRGEGTSFCYVDDPRFPAAANFNLTRLAAERLEKRGLRYLPGTLWTTDGRVAGQYDQDQICRLRARGVLGVEMQSSTLFVLGKVFNFRTANMAIVVDKPAFDDPFAPTPVDPGIIRSCLELVADLARSC